MRFSMLFMTFSLAQLFPLSAGRSRCVAPFHGCGLHGDGVLCHQQPLHLHLQQGIILQIHRETATAVGMFS